MKNVRVHIEPLNPAEKRLLMDALGACLGPLWTTDQDKWTEVLSLRHKIHNSHIVNLYTVQQED